MIEKSAKPDRCFSWLALVRLTGEVNPLVPSFCRPREELQLRQNEAAEKSGFCGDGIDSRYGRALRPGEEGCQEAASGCEGQPESRKGSIAGDVNQVGAESGRETTKGGCGQAVGEGEAGSAHVDGHDFGEEDDHGAVIAAVYEREPEFDAEQAGEGWIADEPEHGGVGGEQHQESASEQERAAADAVGERAHDGEPEKIG